MDNSINTSPEANAKNTLEAFIKEYSDLIFDEEIWKEKELWKIAEVTYSYIYDEQKNKLNTTLFISLWELDINKYNNSDLSEKKVLLLNSKKKLEKILLEKKKLIKEALTEIKKVDILNKKEVESDLREIFINSLLEKNLLIDYCLNWLDFELEKAWLNMEINLEKQYELQKKQIEIDKKLFWWYIKDNPEESKLAYEYIYEKFIENKDKLTSLEIKRLSEYLNKIKKYLPKWYKFQKKEKPKQITWDFLNINIPRKDYIFSFNALIESLKKLEHIAESNEEVKSISDWPKKVQFPTWEKYNSMNMLRFFKLGNHEFETHSITDYNSHQLIWNIRWAWSTEKDEGLAMLMEQLFIYWNNLYKKEISINWKEVYIIDIDKIQINSYFTKTLMWEILNNDELIDFLEIVEKFDPDVSNFKDRFDRLKRNNKFWVQHKDTTYTRWLLKAINQINTYILSEWLKWINPEDLFLWKVSFKETEKLKNILKKKEKQGKSIEIVKPLFISDTVYFIIKEKLEWNAWDITIKKWNISWEKFYKYLKDKYKIFDFTKEEINTISYKTKRNIYWILNVMLKNIWKSNIEQIQSKHKKINTQILKKSKIPALKILDTNYDKKIEKVKNKMHPRRRNAT